MKTAWTDFTIQLWSIGEMDFYSLTLKLHIKTHYRWVQAWFCKIKNSKFTETSYILCKLTFYNKFRLVDEDFYSTFPGFFFWGGGVAKSASEHFLNDQSIK